MATISDLDAKRAEMNTAVQTYKSILQEFKDGIANQSSVDQARTTAQTRADEYAKLAGQVKKDNPGLVEDDFYSDPIKMTQAIRDDVRQIVRTGFLTRLLYDEFTGASLNADLWDVFNASLMDGDLSAGQIRQLGTSPNGAGYQVMGIKSKQQFGPGTAIKARVRMNGRTGILIGMGNSQSQVSGHGNPTPSMTWYARADADESIIGSYRAEGGATGYDTRNGVDFTVYREYELRRVSATRIEFYEDGSLVHVVDGASFASNYSVVFGIDNSAGTDTVLDVDWVEVVGL